MYNLLLYERPATSATAYTGLNLTRHAYSWSRSTRALGGYWLGDFTITPDTMTPWRMERFFNDHIGKRIEERTYSILTWEGLLWEMELTRDGVSYTRSMDPSRTYNRVKTSYTYPYFEDINQGNLTYDPDAGNSFQDDAQDFSDWQTAAGDSVYEIVVQNNDSTEASGFLGAAFTTLNANDSIHTFEDIGRTNSGWNGESSGKTPVSYIVRHVTDAGIQKTTAVSEVTGSSDLYGEMNLIDVVGEMTDAAALANRDRQLSEHAYPNPIPTGGLNFDPDTAARANELHVIVAGFVFTMNWRYFESDVQPLAISTQLGTLVDGTTDAAEFVSAGNIETNTTTAPMSCSEIPMRLWDLAEELIQVGDTTGDRWVGGVYGGREFRYEAAETNVTHFWRNGRLVDRAGYQIRPTLIKPDIIVRIEPSPFGVTPPSGNVWDNPKLVYIREVEFIAPSSYRLIHEDGFLEGGW